MEQMLEEEEEDEDEEERQVSGLSDRPASSA